MSDSMQPQEPVIPGISEQEKTMGMVAHILGLVGWIGPLVFWLIKKDESVYVKEQALESLNFQITVVIGWFAGWLLSAIKLWIIGGPIMFLVGIANLVLVIMAIVASKDGVQHKYPFNLRIIK